MRSFLGKVPVLCITATADRGMRTRLANYLALCNPYKVILSPNKDNIDNIRFSVTQADKELCCLNWVVTMLRKERKDCPYAIIFCQMVNDIALILSYLLTNLGEDAYVEGEAPLAERCLVTVYYSVTPEKRKEQVKSSFESGAGTARTVIATTSLSMGVDFPCVTYVVHFGPSRDLVSHLQEAGYAGRDGKSQAHNVIVYLGKHKALCDNDMKTVLKSKECVRKLLLSPFDDDSHVGPKHRCCNRCHGECDCGILLPVFDQPPAVKNHTGPVRVVTDQQRECLRAAIFEIKANLQVQTSVTV